MSRRPAHGLARLALGLYPLAFRRRYGTEMQALLEETPAGALTALDLLRGAISAHLRPPAGVGEEVNLGERLRGSASGVLACWVAFAAAGFGYYKSTEDAPFEAAGRVHGLLGVTHATMQALSIVGSLALLLGAMPLILTVLAAAWREPDLRGIVATPILAVIVFAGLTALLVLIAHSRHFGHATAAARGAFLAWELAALACGTVCVLAARRALYGVRVRMLWLRTALACATVLTAAMLAMALATGAYATALALDAAPLADSPDGPLGLASVTVSLLVQLGVMLLAGSLATLSTSRAWRAVRRARA